MVFITGVCCCHIICSRSHISQVKCSCSVNNRSSVVSSVDIECHIACSVCRNYNNDCSVSLVNDFDVIRTGFNRFDCQGGCSVCWQVLVITVIGHFNLMISNWNTRNDYFVFTAFNRHGSCNVSDCYGYIACCIFRNGHLNHSRITDSYIVCTSSDFSIFHLIDNDFSSVV